MATTTTNPADPSYEQSKEVAEASRETQWTQPSFGKQLFLGNFQLDLIHPQPQASAEMTAKGEAYLEQMRLFLSERVDPLQIERDAKVPDEVIEGLKAMGALGMKVPEQYGGLGLSQVYYNKVLALCGTWHSAIATSSPPISRSACPSRCGCSAPTSRSASGCPRSPPRTSPRSCSRSPTSARTRAHDHAAVPTEDGTGYKLNGTKLWATNGAIADVVIVMAVVPKTATIKGGITPFICPVRRPASSVETRNAFMGLRGIENSVTRLEDVFVPNEAVVGGVGKGLKLALATLNTGACRCRRSARPRRSTP
jgi:hypothetical protein